MSNLLNKLKELNRSPSGSEVPPEIRVKVARDDEYRSSRKKFIICCIISLLAVLAGFGTRHHFEMTAGSKQNLLNTATPIVATVNPLTNISSARPANNFEKSDRNDIATTVAPRKYSHLNKSVQPKREGFERNVAEVALPVAADKMAEGVSPGIAPPVPSVDKEVRETVILAARSAEKRKAYGEALRIYRNALKTDPDNHCLLNNAASIHIRLGEYATAQTLCEKALLLHREYIPALINLGIARNALGRNREAAESFEQALALDPTHKEAIFNFALFNEKNGKLDAASHAYQRLAVSGDVEGMIGLARIFEKQSFKKEAVKIYVDVASRRDIPADTRNAVLKRLKQLE